MGVCKKSLPENRRIAPGRRSRWRVVRGYLLLPHLAPIIVVELATLGIAFIAWSGLPPFGLLARLLLAMLGGQLAIGAINEIVDLPDDAVGKPQKPLPSGEVSVQGARLVAAFGLALMAVAGVSLGLVSFALLLLGTGLGIVYDLWLKRSMWSWVPYLLALPLLPIWVFVTIGRPEPRLLFLYPLGALAAVGVHLAQALPDVAADQAAGMRTITSRMGAEAAFAAAWVTIIATPLIASVLPRGSPGEAWPGLMAIPIGVALALAIANGIVRLVNRRLAERLCFSLAAVSLVVSALGWTLSIAG